MSFSAENLRAVRSTLKWDRAAALGALNRLFRSGTLPDPLLRGTYAGALFAFQVFPGLDPLADLLIEIWKPWRGKIFEPSTNRGENLFARSSLFAIRLVWPFYKGYTGLGSAGYRAFPFRIRVGPGITDPDRDVLKIDYDLPENPRWIVRQVLDELVQLAPDFYLGKAHFRWLAGRWWTIAYFSCYPPP